MDSRIRELIAIGASVTAHCQPCLSYHVGKAREMGIDEQEIREAIAVGHQVEKGSVSAMTVLPRAYWIRRRRIIPRAVPARPRQTGRVVVRED